MQLIKTAFLTTYKQLLALSQYCYQYPLCSGALLSFLTSIYLIYDAGTVNRSSLFSLWSLKYTDIAPRNTFESILMTGSDVFNIDIVTIGYLLMIFCHVMLMVLLLAIAKLLFFSKTSRWALILLVLAHPTYNDFRTYIIAEPLFWFGWLLALYLLLVNFKKRTVLSILTWFVLFLMLTKISIAAWFWLLLFPFGALLFKPWRRKSVAYALLGYAFVVAILLFLPMYGEETPYNWLISTVIENPNSLVQVLGLDKNTWIKEENTAMAGIFIFSGATSLVVVRTLIVFGVICSGLAIYAIMRRQYQIIDTERFRILCYVLIFGIFISVVLLVLNEDSGTIDSFSFILLFFLMSSLGLSYVFKRIMSGRYSKVSTLIIVWCLVAYFASGFIIFGPRKDYLVQAGTSGLQYNDYPLYSNDPFYLFHAGKDPSAISDWKLLEKATTEHNFYYAHDKNRNKPLPQSLSNFSSIDEYKNSRGDKLLVYLFNYSK